MRPLCPEDTAGRCHWNGEHPLHELSELVDEMQSFVLVQKVHCSLPPGREDLPGKGESPSMIILSRELLLVVTSIAKYHYNARQQEIGDKESSISTAYENNETDYELLPRAEIEDPDTFFYHHEAELKGFCPQSTSCQQKLDELISYVTQAYSSQWMEAKHCFSRGLSPRKHLKRLFEPNKIMLASRFGHRAAFVLRTPPRFVKHDNMILDCWCWWPSRSNLRRFREEFKNSYGWDEEIKIKSLPMFPLDYVESTTLQKLAMRGKKFWTMLNQNKPSHVGYSGWNAEKDEYLVRNTHHLRP